MKLVISMAGVLIAGVVVLTAAVKYGTLPVAETVPSIEPVVAEPVPLGDSVGQRHGIIRKTLT